LRHFWVHRDAAGIGGVIGIEPYGNAALLRSLAVRDDLRARGLGSRLLAHAESQAAGLGVETLYLLTTTAERFFAARGYARTPRDSAPVAIRATREFSELCPSTSTCLSKRVRGQSG
jgi:amino-acid N-acetyltransferase